MTILRMTDAEISQKLRVVKERLGVVPLLVRFGLAPLLSRDIDLPQKLAHAALDDLLGELRTLRTFAAQCERLAKNGDKSDLLSYVEENLCP